MVVRSDVIRCKIQASKVIYDPPRSKPNKHNVSLKDPKVSDKRQEACTKLAPKVVVGARDATRRSKLGRLFATRAFEFEFGGWGTKTKQKALRTTPRDVVVGACGRGDDGNGVIIR